MCVCVGGGMGVGGCQSASDFGLLDTNITI